MKKRVLVSLLLAATLVFAAHAFAADAKSDKDASKTKTQSWTGEIVDMSCYIAHEAKGEKHGKECGTKCVANGTPMGLLMKNGKVHVLTLDHDNADPYNACKNWVGSQVEVSGVMADRGGISAIDVTGAKPAAAAPTK